MQLNQFKDYMHHELSVIHEFSEINSFFNILILFQLQLERVDVVLNSQLVIKTSDLNFLKNAVAELKLEKPIQYILSETEFYGLTFKVSEATLIPRPETEELVDWIINECKMKPATFQILEIGTGSGCIPISLAKNLINSEVTSVDISEKALAIASENARENGVTIDFVRGDFLLYKDFLNDQKWEIIVSNPPYVRNLEKEEIKTNVLAYEPHLALFVEDDDALIFYKEIGEYAFKKLTKTGQLFFEINQYLSKETVLLLQQIGFQKVELRKDFSGNDRMIMAMK